MVHDLCKSYAEKLQKPAQAYLKKWSGAGRTVEEGVLYRSRERFGLGLTSVSDHYQNMQLVKCQLLDTSIDSNVCEVYAARREQHKKESGRIWRSTRLNSEVDAQVALDILYPSQTGRQGLGAGNYNPNLTRRERRQLCTTKAKYFAPERQL